jgi:hypothetical protein
MSRPHRDARAPRTFVPGRRRASAPSSSPVISAIGRSRPAPSRGAGLDVVEMCRAANNPIVDRRLSHSRPRDGQRACRQGRGRGAAHTGGDEEQAVCRYAHRPEDQCWHARPVLRPRRHDGAEPGSVRAALRPRGGAGARRPARRRALAASPPSRPSTCPLAPTPASTRLALTSNVNQVLERWIRERPAHWFCGRWPD